MPKILKQPYFYTSLFAFVILALLIGQYVLGWTIPTLAPPGGNLPAPLNVSATDQSKIGKLAVGTSTAPVYTLDLTGVLRLGKYASAPSGASGALYYDTASNSFQGYTASGWAALGGGTPPGGSTTQVQFNNAGAFAGDSALTWNNSTKQLTVGTAVGTAPFVVTNSTTRVANLNADTVDGYHATDFLAAPLTWPSYYITTGTYQGNTASTACTTGYHMCFWNEEVGRSVAAGSAQGLGTYGQIWFDNNTSYDSYGVYSHTAGDCGNWTTNVVAHWGSVWAVNGEGTRAEGDCSISLRVLCCSN